MMAMQQVSALPTGKSNIAGIAVAIVTVITWAAKQFYNIDIPGYAGAAMAGIIGYGFAYFAPPAERDHIQEAEDEA